MLRMTDARERFSTRKTFAFEVDLRLIPDLEPMIAQSLGDRDARPLGVHPVGFVVLRAANGRVAGVRRTRDVLLIGIGHACKPVNAVVTVYGH